MQQRRHQPKINGRADGTWVVECAQCDNDTTSDLPVGIGMPLQARETAELLRDNHAGVHGRRVAS
jgi:hypothetical protein